MSFQKNYYWNVPYFETVRKKEISGNEKKNSWKTKRMNAKISIMRIKKGEPEKCMFALTNLTWHKDTFCARQQSIIPSTIFL